MSERDQDTRAANVAVVELAFRCYRAGDEATARPLYAADFTFTSPQDDHIDGDAFFARCFPTADRFVAQEMLSVTPADDDLVLAYYEYELESGARHRNIEAITVQGGTIREVQVFFGGRVG